MLIITSLVRDRMRLVSCGRRDRLERGFRVPTLLIMRGLRRYPLDELKR